MRRALSYALALLVCAVPGCLGTETGNPPVSPELDVSRLDLVAEEGGVAVVGLPGAVAPAGGSVHLVNLDGTAGLATAEVAADGSFRVATPGDGAHRFRVQAKRGALRSVPVDLELAALPSTLLGCVATEPSLVFDLGSARVGEPVRVPIGLENGCGIEVTLERARLRLGDPAFSLEAPATPRALAGGERLAFDLVLMPSAPGEVEDVVLLELAAGADGGRIAITVYGEGVP